MKVHIMIFRLPEIPCSYEHTNEFRKVCNGEYYFFNSLTVKRWCEYNPSTFWAFILKKTNVVENFKCGDRITMISEDGYMLDVMLTDHQSVIIYGNIQVHKNYYIGQLISFQICGQWGVKCYHNAKL